MTVFITFFTTFVWPMLKGFFGMVLRFAVSPGNWVVAGLAVAIAFGVGHHKGKVKANHAWEAKIAIERVRQKHAVEDADAEAQKQIKRLESEQEIRDAQINELLAAADSDPNAGRPAISAAGVHDLNRIGPRQPKQPAHK